MNSGGNCSLSERPIFGAVNSAFDISDVRFAALLNGCFGRRSSVEERSFAAKQSSSLFCFGFFGRDFAESRLSNSFSGFIGSGISTKAGHHVSVSFNKMFACRKAFKIFKSIISFVAVDMVDMINRVKIIHPTFSNNSMHEQFSHKQDRKSTRLNSSH